MTRLKAVIGSSSVAHQVHHMLKGSCGGLGLSWSWTTSCVLSSQSLSPSTKMGIKLVSWLWEQIFPLMLNKSKQKSNKVFSYHDFLFAFHGFRHYPIGVLFDLHASNTVLPWSITVHFKVKGSQEFFGVGGTMQR